MQIFGNGAAETFQKQNATGEKNGGNSRAG